MTLAQLVNRFETVERSLVIVNRTDPDPVFQMLTDTFSDSPVRTVDHRPGGPAFDDGEFTIDVGTLCAADGVPFDGEPSTDVENLVLLLEDGEVIAGSTLEELTEAVLFVNSDLYTTGTRGLDAIELPRVIGGLEDTVFRLRGYPESNRQKLLLITISRFIERVAWTAGAGTIRSSFQRLSRLTDEIGTRRVYERLGAAGVDTHLYGVPDDPPRDLDAVIHGGRSIDFTDSWFVVFEPPGGPCDVPADDESNIGGASTDGGTTTGVDTASASDLKRGMTGGVALLAVETEPRLWQGAWTFDTNRIRTLTRYIRRNL